MVYRNVVSRTMALAPIDTSPANPPNKVEAAPSDPPPRSDPGTIVLHWTLAIAIIVSLATGLRLAADDNTLWFAKLISPILPQGEVWTAHFIAAFMVISGIIIYPLYLRFGNLQRRVAIKKTIVLTLSASPRLKWGAFNIILYWGLFFSIISLSITGVLLYFGEGNWIVTIHYTSALIVMAYIVLHIFSHFAYGGFSQLLRLFRPRPLRLRSGAMKWPLAIATAAGLVTAVAIVGLDRGLQDVLRIQSVVEAPNIDGDLTDPAWREAKPVEILTMQGVNLGGTGESKVLVRAVHDAENVYFAFQWSDPDRSIKRLPLIKREDGWHLINEGADVADENRFYEDKFAVTFSRSDAYGNGGSTHMGPQPLSGKPGALNKRGLHYTTDGSYMDMWQWKASRGGLLGVVDDMWFGPPVEPNEGQTSGELRYSAGYDGDPGKKFYSYNWVNEPPGGYRGPVNVVRLPKHWRATSAKLGTVSFEAGSSDDPDSQWWMFDSESVPYDASVDAEIPLGTIIPGVLISGAYEGSRADVHGAAKWLDGWWTLETVRKLRTDDHLKDLPIENGLFMWVAVFDRTQTRHTRHVRPVELEID